MLAPVSLRLALKLWCLGAHGADCFATPDLNTCFGPFYFGAFGIGETQLQQYCVVITTIF